MRRPRRSTGQAERSADTRTAGAATPWRPRALLAILICVVGLVMLAVQWPVLRANALFIDDHEYLVDNQLVQDPGWSSASRFIREVFEPSTVGGYYQPLSMISLMVDCALGGRPDNLRTFHATSLGLHVANTVLVIVLLYMLFGEPWTAALAGLLFGVHPLHVESIAWIGERKTLLAALFALACLVLYVRYARRPHWSLYAACLVTYVLALLSKPTSTPLPVLMLLLDCWPLRRLHRRAVLEKVPFLVVGAISAVITYISQRLTAGAGLPGEYPASRVPLVLCHNIVFYLWKVFWPAHLSPFYAFPDAMAISDRAILVGVVGTCILIPALLVSLRWTRAVLTGWLFFFVAILPTMGIIGFTVVIAADRFTYLPMVGLLLPVACFLSLWWARGPLGKPARAVTVLYVLIVVVAEAFATRTCLKHWRDTESLYRYALTSAPKAPWLHANLAAALNSKGQFDEGIAHCEAALKVRPDDPEARNNLGGALLEKGRYKEAVEQYREALRLRPRYAMAHHNLAIALHALGRSDEAIKEWNEALRLRPLYADAHNCLGSALLEAGKADEAVDHYRRALAIQPEHFEARYNLASALVRQGRIDDAIAAYTELVRRYPNHALTHHVFARLLAWQGRIEDATREYRAVLALEPANAAARKELDAVSSRAAGTSRPSNAASRSTAPAP